MRLPLPSADTTSRLGARLDWLFAVLASMFLFAMMLLTFLDVGARYFFSRPVAGSLEITELLMVGLIFTGLPLVSRRGEHVAIDLLDQRFPERLRVLLGVLIELVCALALSGLAGLLLRKATQLAEYGDETAVLGIAIAPFVFGMSAMTAVTALIHLAKVIVRCARLSAR